MSTPLRPDPGKIARQFGFSPPIPVVRIVNDLGFELYEGSIGGNVEVKGKKITVERALPVFDKRWWAAVGLALALQGTTKPQNSDLMWAARLVLPAELLSLYYLAAKGDLVAVADRFEVPRTVMARRSVILLGARDDYSALLVSETTAG